MPTSQLDRFTGSVPALTASDPLSPQLTELQAHYDDVQRQLQATLDQYGIAQRRIQALSAENEELRGNLDQVTTVIPPTRRRPNQDTQSRMDHMVLGQLQRLCMVSIDSKCRFCF